MSARFCRKCAALKPLEEFSWRSKRLGQRYATCKKCQSVEAKANRGKYKQKRSLPSDHAHLCHELHEDWHVITAYRVLTQPLGVSHGA